MALVGSYVGLSKSLLLVFPVFLLAGLRFGIAGVVMLGWLRRAPGEHPLSPREHRLLFVESFFGNFLFSVCMLFGMSLTSALAAGVIMAGIPAAVAVLSRLLLKEHIAARTAMAIALAVGGIALVSLAGHDAAGPGSLLGNLMLVGAIFCEAVYVVIGKRLSDSLGPRRISALVNLWGLVLMAPLALWQAMSFDFAAVTLPSWTLLLFYSLAASVVTVWLWMSGLRRVPASRAGVFTVLLPVSAAAIGVGLLGEHITGLQCAAFGLALAGVVLATWPTRVR